MRMAISTLNKAKDGSARRSAVRRPFEELHAKVTTAARHHEAQENMRQHEVAEPEERRAHLRVIALEKIMSELEIIENGLGHALAGLGGAPLQPGTAAPATAAPPIAPPHLSSAPPPQRVRVLPRSRAKGRTECLHRKVSG